MADALEWRDVSQEKFRIYRFPGGHAVRIDNPLKIAVTSSGSHRVITADGQSFYVAPGFLAIEWDGPVLF